MSERLSKNKRKSKGPRSPPWGTPDVTAKKEDVLPEMIIRSFPNGSFQWAWEEYYVGLH